LKAETDSVMLASNAELLMQKIAKPLGSSLICVLWLVQVGVLVRQWLKSVPVWTWCADPCYQYLLVGGGIVRGQPAGIVEHPGTSLQWYGGTLSYLLHIMNGNGNTFAQDLVDQPEFFLKYLNLGLLVLYAATLALLTWRIWKFFGWSGALALQAVFLWELDFIIPNVSKLSPESFMLICAMVILSLLAPQLNDLSARTTWSEMLGISAALAIGVSAKILFLPACLLIAMILPLRKAAISLCMSLAIFLLISIPTYSQLDRIWLWFGGLASRSGRHGEGSETSTLANLSHMLEGLTWSLPRLSFLVALLAVLLMVVGLMRPRGFATKNPRALGGILITVFSGLLIGIKPSEARDFAWLAPFVAVLFAIVLQQVMRIVRWKFRVLLYAIPVLLVATLGVTSLRINEMKWQEGLVRTDFVLVQASEFTLDEASPTATGYGVWSEPVALSLANEWQFGEFSTEIASKYGNLVEFNVFDGNFYFVDRNKGRFLPDCSELGSLIAKHGLKLRVQDSANIRWTGSGGHFIANGAEVIATQVSRDDYLYHVSFQRCVSSNP
jgi:hypothetical protein